MFSSERTEVGAANRMLSDGTYAYQYDAEGNRRFRWIDDGDGELETGESSVTEYCWDYRNRLVEVVEYAQHGQAATSRIEYTYDHLNRMTARKVDGDANGSFDEEEYFAYDGTQIVMRYDGSGEFDLRNVYLTGPGTDRILADEQIHYETGQSQYVTDTVVWPLADHLGTIRDLVQYDGGLS